MSTDRSFKRVASRNRYGAFTAVAVAAALIACGGSYGSEETAPAPIPSAPDADAGVPIVEEAGTVGDDAGDPDAGPAVVCAVDPDRAPCVASSCPKDSCFAPSHVPKAFGTYAKNADLANVILTEPGATWNTSTGEAGGLRSPNVDPLAFEVKQGVGFIRLVQGMGAPDVGVWVFKALTLGGSGALTFTGSASAVLASAGNLTVNTLSIDVAAKGTAPGPGGFVGGKYQLPGTGCAPGAGSTTAGAGGGAFGTNGQAGGTASSGAGGAGGQASTCASFIDLVVLGGGSGGGGSDDSDSSLTIPFGGGGGGAIQLTAFGALTLNGAVNAGGGGGRTPQGNSRRGAGGGSGGAILLESPMITLGGSAGFFANGGGGGSTSSGTGTPCGGVPAVAENGKASLTAALGGHCGTGFGGNGAAGAVAAKPGATAAGPATGGGGGGLGRIVLRTLPNVTPAIDPATAFSPPSTSAAYRLLQTLGN